MDEGMPPAPPPAARVKSVSLPPPLVLNDTSTPLDASSPANSLTVSPLGGFTSAVRSIGWTPDAGGGPLGSWPQPARMTAAPPRAIRATACLKHRRAPGPEILDVGGMEPLQSQECERHGKGSV